VIWTDGLPATAAARRVHAIKERQMLYPSEALPMRVLAKSQTEGSSRIAAV